MNIEKLTAEHKVCMEDKRLTSAHLHICKEKLRAMSPNENEFMELFHEKNALVEKLCLLIQHEKQVLEKIESLT